MKLFHVQDSDNPMYVLAESWQDAADIWRKRLEEDCGGEGDEEPDGISCIADREDDLDVRAARRDLLKFRSDIIEAVLVEFDSAHDVNCSDVHDALTRICEKMKIPTMRDQDIPF
jgi:hypothetical protein